MNCKLPISVIVLTYNEERNIDACLRSIADWAGEIVVVDSGSQDRTVEIARRYTTHVVDHPFKNYAKQRNWAQDSLPLAFDWVFHIDADERVSPQLQSDLRDFFSGGDNVPRTQGLLVRRRIVFWGRHIKHGGLYPTYHCRVFRRQAGRCEDREYDQHFVVNGPLKRLESDLTEVTSSSLASWMERHNRWAQMEATHLENQGGSESTSRLGGRIGGSPIEQRRWLRASVYERAPIFVRAYLYFALRYIVRAGFLDGLPGLVYHFLHGFWFRFYVDALYWEAQHGLAGKEGAAA